MKKIGIIMAATMAAAILFTGCGSASAGRSADEVNNGVYSNGISCHDPQIILADDGNYYMTGSHQVLARSADLKSWDYIVNGDNMFSNIFDGDKPAFAYVGQNEEGGYSIWASNIFYNETMKKYVMYFCTTSTYIKSNLCMAVSDKPEGPYEYTDTLVYSGFTKKEAEQTNIYEVLGADADISRYIKHGGFNNKEYPNCIDPALFTDKDGKIWMTYGSWSGGIFILEIDPATGLPIFPKDDPAADPYYGYHLIGGEHHAVEGPFIIYSPESGYYHLFVSYGNLQANGGYQIRQFRSESPAGPYVDPSGKTLNDEDDFMNYGLKMMGNYTLPSLAVTYMAPGGQSAFVDKDGDYCLTYHQRFSDKGEYHEPRVHKMFLTEDGWFTASVFETNTDALSEKGYKTKDISGRFYILNHGLDVSDAVHEYEEATFANGEFKSESFNGKYEVKDGTSFITLTTDDGTYQGIIEEMTDESKNEVLTISAVGDNNETIWAVKYK